jgi:ERCC4-type nuclease
MKGESTNRKAFYLNKNVAASTVLAEEKAEIDSAGSGDSTEEFPEQTEEPKDNTKEYISMVKKVKKENITIENIDEIMLCQIPGVSTATAVSIIKKFNSIANLIKCLEENEKCLADVTNTNGKGQSRKITKTSIANIMKFLLKK